MKLFSIIGSLFSLIQTVVSFNITQLEIGVWLSGAAYCDKSEYPTMNLAGPADGFIYKETLYDPKTDLNGYIGVLPSTRTIYVVIRGTNSLLNWVDDLEVRFTPYADCDCNVHTGFYNSVLQIANKTRYTIRFLKARYPFYSIISTGHSYGAATSALLALEIQKDGFPVDIYNYGQPRIGDAAFSQYANSQIKNYWRTTHDKDMVPHLPPTDPFLYKHSTTEIFEDEMHELHICSFTNGEDPECSAQYSLKQTNTDDHSYYLEHFFDCSASTQPI